MRMYVGGEWTDGARQEELRSPYSGEVIDTVPVGTLEDVERALASAVRGAAHQRRTTGHEREAILRRAGDLADARVEDLAATISRESGKAIAEARGEAGRGGGPAAASRGGRARAGALRRLSGFEATQLYGDSLPLDASAGAGLHWLGFTLRQPCGVVVAITPFNYPLLLVLHKIAPALAAGNSVVLKPARQTPLTALKLVEILLEAGLAPEAISCLTGPGGELGDALVSDPRVRKISFTGSTTTGEAIARAAGIKKLSLELGASCPVAILPDADIELAAQAVALGGYANAGQVCISVQRVLADRAIVGDFLDALVPKVEAIRAGDPSRADIGTLISEREARRVETALEAGTRENGARLLTGGERDGAVISPAVVADVHPDAAISQDELV